MLPKVRPSAKSPTPSSMAGTAHVSSAVRVQP
jgi:hypothetical protein